MFTQTRLLILELLNTNPSCKYFDSELVKDSQGRLTLGKASEQLVHLVTKGYVMSEQESDKELRARGLPGAIRRHKYQITEHGLREIRRLRSCLSSPAPEPA